jgi:release factor glutamine methyltransferase
MTAAEALRAAIARLREARIPDPARDARLLLAHALGLGVDRLTLHLHDAMPETAQTRLESALTARLTRQPVSQITGARAFWGRSFSVTPAVLDPRPETETLIAEALRHPFSRVLDLGTGSGAILLTLLAERPLARGLGVDLSPDALAVAARNADRLGVADRTRLEVSDWFGAVQGQFDLIVSNPPYIAAGEMALLSPEVRLHEPHLALTPGGDGLGAYRRIAAGAPGFAMPGARLMLEIGPTQAASVGDMLTHVGFSDIATLVDFDGRDRVVTAMWRG